MILHGHDVGQSAIAVTGQMTSCDGDKSHDEIETDALGYVFSSGELGATDVSLSQADPRPQLSLADDGTLILPPDFQQLAVEEFHSDEFTVEQTAEAAENPPLVGRQLSGHRILDIGTRPSRHWYPRFASLLIANR